MSFERIRQMGIWLNAPATRLDVIVIALGVGFVLAVVAGLGAEHAAKSYARELVSKCQEGK